MSAYAHHSVKDRVVLVTGGGGGLGAAICKTLGEDGARLAVLDISEESAQRTAADIAQSGGSASAWKADVSQEDSIVTVLGHVVERFGRLDAIINNAGVDVTIGIQDLASEDWHRVMATNLSGPFFFAKHGLKHLALGGHIINIASTAARRAWPNASAYHASKWGLLGLTQALHAELRGNGIKVSAIIAGGMRTPFLLDRFPDIDVELLQDPVHVAHAVRFVLTQPPQTVIPEIMVLPMKETSWP